MSELTPEQRADLANGRTRPMHSLEDEAIVKRLLAQLNARAYFPGESATKEQPIRGVTQGNQPGKTLSDVSAPKPLCRSFTEQVERDRRFLQAIRVIANVSAFLLIAGALAVVIYGIAGGR